MSSTTAPEKREFQAEVSQVLDIVINSLYTDKEIFVRELVSNASDALEKLRHTQLTENEIHQPDLELNITIAVDKEAKTITIADHGLGMTRDELHENLGTIAHSGSKAFMKALEESKQKESSLIGQFGVGFYSAFMVADEVVVRTRSWRTDGESLVWTSDGKTGYEIEDSEEEIERGSQIILKLREECEEFAEDGRIKQILENYSSFVSFPILMGEDRINTVEAIWRKKKSEVTEEEYNEFYKFTAKAFDEPRYRMHFSADMPIEINALLFAPTENTELFGMGQMEAGVSLYCKNVLIDDKPEGLLPEWLRFLRGVIDSADIPLNISRESMQDSSLVRKLNRVVTKRFLKFLDGEAKDDAGKYKEFYGKFSRFLKEGIVVDFDHREPLAKLLRFESSMTEKGELTSFEEYLTRAKDGQEKIYYLSGTDRAAVEAGPYLEALKSRGLEVIFFTDTIDEYLLQHLREFDGKSLVSAASAGLELEDDDSIEQAGEALPEETVKSLCEFLKEQLGESVGKVESGKRLVSSPVAVLTPEHGMAPQMRQMMQAMNPDEPLPPIQVEMEINPHHPLIHSLAAAQESNPELAKLVAGQLFDQALLAAGLLEDRTSLVNRGFQLMEEALKK
ncbi:MAG: molecular chaperone HtpG [Verrucomicrobiales bacterium]|jgi:molecular chaperone HtpG|nr:molecular chaperone HtpG [Verrucomicrobiales bacterium]